MVLNKAHILQNLDTQASQCLHWFHGNFNLLLTVTPTFNIINNFLGIVPFILNLQQELPPVLDNFHPLMVNDNTLPILFIIPRLYKFVFQDKELSGITKGQALCPI
jgi:SNF2 family DNA or RNA helicase